MPLCIGSGAQREETNRGTVPPCEIIPNYFEVVAFETGSE